MTEEIVKDGRKRTFADGLLHLMRVELTVKQMIKLGHIDHELFEKYYEEVEE